MHAYCNPSFSLKSAYWEYLIDQALGVFKKLNTHARSAYWMYRKIYHVAVYPLICRFVA
uniref:Uncharacterized protein n=1 Tax=Arundo donax TaxID=35708 RepID=A0A0A9E4U2_ARUDO